MPAKSAKQYGLMQMASKGQISGIAPSFGKEFVDKTPASKRSKFAKALMKKRKKRDSNDHDSDYR